MLQGDSTLRALRSFSCATSTCLQMCCRSSLPSFCQTHSRLGPLLAPLRSWGMVRPCLLTTSGSSACSAPCCKHSVRQCLRTLANLLKGESCLQGAQQSLARPPASAQCLASTLACTKVSARSELLCIGDSSAPLLLLSGLKCPSSKLGCAARFAGSLQTVDACGWIGCCLTSRAVALVPRSLG